MFSEKRESNGFDTLDPSSDIAFICEYFPEVCQGTLESITNPIDLAKVNAAMFETYQERMGFEGTSLRNLHHLGQLTMVDAF